MDRARAYPPAETTTEGEDAMPYEVPPLPYAFEALEPTIDAKTMEIHHDKHHQAYVTNLNAALEGTEWADRPVEQVIENLEAIPDDKRAAVRNNGGGHVNHTFFWQIMKPGGGGDPSGALADAINDTFGDADQLRRRATTAASSGSAPAGRGSSGDGAAVRVGRSRNKDSRSWQS